MVLGHVGVFSMRLLQLRVVLRRLVIEIVVFVYLVLAVVGALDVCHYGWLLVIGRRVEVEVRLLGIRSRIASHN